MGTLTPGQVIPTAGANNFPAEIVVSGDGRFVYASNQRSGTVTGRIGPLEGSASVPSVGIVAFQ